MKSLFIISAQADQETGFGHFSFSALKDYHSMRTNNPIGESLFEFYSCY
jgi:hypothetical protein